MSFTAFQETVSTFLSPSQILSSDADKVAFEQPWRGAFAGKAALVLLPETTEQVSAIMKAATVHAINIVAQGGNTGLVGGSTPDNSGTEVVLSLKRMRRIHHIDPVDMTALVDAGVILAELKATCLEQDVMFPLGLASEGSATIGGNIASNAGGTQVLQYGHMRHLVLGLEVVLADGTILPMLRALHKDNTGYDLKQLFIGSEGTLGIITKAVLRLFPRPKQVETALLAVNSVSDALHLLNLARQHTASHLAACEIMHHLGVSLVEKHLGLSYPLAAKPPYSVLIELNSPDPHTPLRPLFDHLLEEAMAKGWVQDGSIAESEAQRRHIWHIRELISEAERKEGAMINHDISVPIAAFADFIEQAIIECSNLIPGIRPLPFGHMGDGNIHFNLLQPTLMEAESFLQQKATINQIIYRLVQSFNGSMSAEHGIGREKIEAFKAFCDPGEYQLMQQLKQSLDPHGRLNPHRVLL